MQDCRSLTKLTRTRVIAEARNLVNDCVPYRHMGRDRIGGTDCGGVAVLVARKLDYNFKDMSEYSRLPDGSLIPFLAEHLDYVEKSMVEPGDLCVFWFDRITKVGQHVAILTDDMTIVHAYIKSKRVVEIPLDSRWLRRMLCGFRFRGIE